MGACNGYRYHDLRPDLDRPFLLLVSVRGEREARCAAVADEAMLRKIASAPEEVEELY